MKEKVGGIIDWAVYYENTSGMLVFNDIHTLRISVIVQTLPDDNLLAETMTYLLRFIATKIKRSLFRLPQDKCFWTIK